MAVYFLGTDAVPLIKIGYTDNDARLRLASCQTGSPVSLYIAAVYQLGDELTDHELRWRFRSSHSHGDWFYATEALLDVVSSVQKNERCPGAWHAPVVRRAPFGRRPAQFGTHFKAVVEKYRLNLNERRKLGEKCRFESRGIAIPTMPWSVSHLRSLGHRVTHRDLFDHNEATIWGDPPGHYEQLVQTLSDIAPASEASAPSTQAKSA